MLLGNCVFCVCGFGPTPHSLCYSSVSPAAVSSNNGCAVVWGKCLRVYSKLVPFCLLSLLICLCRKAVNSWCQQGIGRYELLVCCCCCCVKTQSDSPLCLFCCCRLLSARLFFCLLTIYKPSSCFESHLSVLAHLVKLWCLPESTD